MSSSTQKPGSTPDKPGPHVVVNPSTGKPVSPPHGETTKPGAGHMPPTPKPGQEWKPAPAKK